jgi:Leucine-rich repeat (LRR) protein
LDLRNNLIKKFKSSTFEGLDKLEGINLIRNRIEYIQNFVFTKASNLRMLQLS